ncbi:hypothetical protein N431DRAFT_439374 [Stipitochalara longipes BDJ]|nr:hypothetical protein N431DRAFT_439374 [Stipitochalara longipes BDJ]
MQNNLVNHIFIALFLPLFLIAYGGGVAFGPLQMGCAGNCSTRRTLDERLSEVLSTSSMMFDRSSDDRQSMGKLYKEQLPLGDVWNTPIGSSPLNWRCPFVASHLGSTASPPTEQLRPPTPQILE